MFIGTSNEPNASTVFESNSVTEAPCDSELLGFCNVLDVTSVAVVSSD